MGHDSALVYKDNFWNAESACAAVRLYGAIWRTAEQLFIAAISPWRVGFPIAEFEFAPMQMRSPRGLVVSVWFTITEPKAAKGHGFPRSAKA